MRAICVDVLFLLCVRSCSNIYSGSWSCFIPRSFERHKKFFLHFTFRRKFTQSATRTRTSKGRVFSLMSNVYTTLAWTSTTLECRNGSTRPRASGLPAVWLYRVPSSKQARGPKRLCWAACWKWKNRRLSLSSAKSTRKTRVWFYLCRRLWIKWAY